MSLACLVESIDVVYPRYELVIEESLEGVLASILGGFTHSFYHFWGSLPTRHGCRHGILLLLRRTIHVEHFLAILSKCGGPRACMDT